MSSAVTLEDQMRDSRRGPRILGEFTQGLFQLVQGEESGIQDETVYGQQSKIPAIPTINNWEFELPQDPFSLSLRDFLSLDLDVARDLQHAVYELCRKLLGEAWERGVRHAVICDGKIVFESRDTKDISNETIEKLAQKYNKACYVFSAPDEVEESVWTPVSHNDDFYPTLCIYFGPEDFDESQIVNSSPIYPDLDTGNPSYKIFDANQLPERLIKLTALQMRQGTHLGRNYTYFLGRVKMCVKDINGKINSIVCNVRVVRDWVGSALLQVSPNRTGYVGRDLLRDLGIRVELDPVKKITRILDVAS